MAILGLTGQAQTRRDFTISLSADSAASLHVYLPEHANGRAVIACPGGGYAMLSMEHEGTDWASYFNDQGIAYAVLTYRLPAGNRELPLSDAREAVLTVRREAKAWGIDPHQVGIMGFSAGGHLAAITATTATDDCRPDFQILFYPVITMDEKTGHRGSTLNFLGASHSDTATVSRYSADMQVRSGVTPPAFITLANDDSAVPPLTNGLSYYAALLKAHVPVAFHAYPNGGHGYGFRPSFPYHKEVLAELSAWLKHLAPNNVKK